MVELTDAQYEKIDKAMDSVIKIEAILLGSESDKGLVGKVNDVCESNQKLNRNFWMLVALLIGLGIIGGGLWGLLGG